MFYEANEFIQAKLHCVPLRQFMKWRGHEYYKDYNILNPISFQFLKPGPRI